MTSRVEWIRHYEKPSSQFLKKANAINRNREARKILKYAFIHAQQDEHRMGNHCAIILHGSWDNVVSVSVNNKVRHAEVGAIELMPPGIDRSECFMVVVRATIRGKMKNSMPCCNCMDTLKMSGISSCIYSNGHFNFTRWNI